MLVLLHFYNAVYLCHKETKKNTVHSFYFKDLYTLKIGIAINLANKFTFSCYIMYDKILLFSHIYK